MAGHKSQEEDCPGEEDEIYSIPPNQNYLLETPYTVYSESYTTTSSTRSMNIQQSTSTTSRSADLAAITPWPVALEIRQNNPQDCSNLITALVDRATIELSRTIIQLNATFSQQLLAASSSASAGISSANNSAVSTINFVFRSASIESSSAAANVTSAQVALTSATISLSSALSQLTSVNTAVSSLASATSRLSSNLSSVVSASSSQVSELSASLAQLQAKLAGAPGTVTLSAAPLATTSPDVSAAGLISAGYPPTISAVLERTITVKQAAIMTAIAVLIAIFINSAICWCIVRMKRKRKTVPPLINKSPPSPIKARLPAVNPSKRSGMETPLVMDTALPAVVSPTSPLTPLSTIEIGAKFSQSLARDIDPRSLARAVSQPFNFGLPSTRTEKSSFVVEIPHTPTLALVRLDEVLHKRFVSTSDEEQMPARKVEGRAPAPVAVIRHEPTDERRTEEDIIRETGLTKIEQDRLAFKLQTAEEERERVHAKNDEIKHAATMELGRLREEAAYEQLMAQAEEELRAAEERERLELAKEEKVKAAEEKKRRAASELRRLEDEAMEQMRMRVELERQRIEEEARIKLQKEVEQREMLRVLEEEAQLHEERKRREQAETERTRLATEEKLKLAYEIRQAKQLEREKQQREEEDRVRAEVEDALALVREQERLRTERVEMRAKEIARQAEEARLELEGKQRLEKLAADRSKVEIEAERLKIEKAAEETRMRVAAQLVLEVEEERNRAGAEQVKAAEEEQRARLLAEEDSNRRKQQVEQEIGDRRAEELRIGQELMNEATRLSAEAEMAAIREDLEELEIERQRQGRGRSMIRTSDLLNSRSSSGQGGLTRKARPLQPTTPTDSSLRTMSPLRRNLPGALESQPRSMTLEPYRRKSNNLAAFNRSRTMSPLTRNPYLSTGDTLRRLRGKATVVPTKSQPFPAPSTTSNPVKRDKPSAKFSSVLTKFTTLATQSPEAVNARNEVSQRALGGIYIPSSLREQAVRNGRVVEKS